MSGDRLRLGFIALDDAAALIVADALGYFADEGLEVDLVREVSWATMRDKLAVGALDGAHLLAPLALATSLGIPGGAATPLVAPMALNLNGPAITLSSSQLSRCRLRSEDGVGEDDEFPSDGVEDEAFGFTGGDEALGEDFEVWM